MKTTKEKIEIMQAYERGEQIQIYYPDTDEWEDVESTLLWDWVNFDYRIKSKNLDKLIKSEFKDGDILFAESLHNWIFIFKQNENKKSIYKYVAVPVCTFDTSIYINDAPLCDKEDISEIRFATEEERQQLFNAIKEHGYQWNNETKTLTNLSKLKFIIGDVIQHENGAKVRITEINFKYEFYRYSPINIIGQGIILFSDQNEWKLVSDKFDITTLKPFDRVLMRSSNAREWDATLFSHYSNDKFYGCGMCCDQCIPYEGNEHLLGTTNDCDDFYINW